MAESFPASVAVIGGGRMGAGIAHAFLMRGSMVTVVEPGAEQIEIAGQVVSASVRKSCDRLGVEAGPFVEQLRLVANVADIDLSSGLVIEAVPESADLKARVLCAAEQRVEGHALLASNTSSLSISELAARLSIPERFIGMHFFNPVPSSSLVELVVGAATDSATVERAESIVAALAKTSIVVRDSPGFATSRLGLTLGLEAMRMLEEGVASAEDIDQAMALGYRHPIGPLRLTDMVGLDVRLAVAEHLNATLGPRFEPPRILREKVRAGQLGNKSGEGFYVWR